MQLIAQSGHTGHELKIDCGKAKRKKQTERGRESVFCVEQHSSAAQVHKFEQKLASDATYVHM